MRIKKNLAKRILPRLLEEERIYFNVHYMARHFAQACHCGFDSEKKLWFTGAKNRYIEILIELYGIDEQTNELARQLLKDELKKRNEGNE